jgi:hypothetical protein
MVEAGCALQALHRGAHETIGTTIAAIETSIRQRGLTRFAPLIEYHFNHEPPEAIAEQVSVASVYARCPSDDKRSRADAPPQSDPVRIGETVALGAAGAP